MADYILWDFEGTLAYRRETWSKTLFILVKEYGIEDMKFHRIQMKMGRCFPWYHSSHSHEKLLQGKSWWEYVCNNIIELLISEGVEAIIAKEIGINFKERYLQFSHWRLYEDTLSSLQMMKQKGFKQYLVSNHVPQLEEIAAYLKIDYYFDQIFSSANIGYDKPNRHFFQYVMDHGEEDARFFMIGDHFQNDIKGAEALGIPSILVRCKIHKNKTPYYCSTAAGVSDILDQLVQV